MRLVDFIVASERGTDFIVSSLKLSDGLIRFTREDLLDYNSKYAEIYVILSAEIKSFVPLNYKLIEVQM